MEALYDLDQERGKARPGTARETNPESYRAHKLFARLVESEAGLGLLPAEELNMSSASRRMIYDHVQKLKVIINSIFILHSINNT